MLVVTPELVEILIDPPLKEAPVIVLPEVIEPVKYALPPLSSQIFAVAGLEPPNHA
jgi:hypothetical protein